MTAMNEPDDLPPQDAAPAQGLPSNAKVLLRVVYIMGIILVLLFLLLIGGIIWKSSKRNAPPVEAPPATLNLGLPAGTDLRAAQIDGDRLVINTGREVIVVDVKKNAVISRISAGP